MKDLNPLKWEILRFTQNDGFREDSMNRLNIGDPAPEFALPDQEGRTLKLSDFQGKKLLLYFYPRADTPGCTK